MEPIRLALPSEDYLDQVWAYRQECLDANSSMDGCGPLRRIEDPAEWLTAVISYTDPATLPEGKVLATQFLAIRELDGRLVGMFRYVTISTIIWKSTPGTSATLSGPASGGKAMPQRCSG